MVVIKNKHQRVGIFIDTQNLYHSAKNIHNARVNFASLIQSAVADRVLVRSIAYMITTENGDENSFLGALNNIGIETKTKDLQIFASGAKKADWDVGIAIDMISLAPKLDVMCLVSGDGDFVPAINYIKLMGCQVEVLAFEKTCSAQLKQVADDFINLSDDKKYFLTRISTAMKNTTSKKNVEQKNG